MNLKKFGCFLKKLRQEKGATQEQIAEIFGVSARTVSRWETGTNMPDLSLLIQIAEYYDVDIKELLNGEREGEHMESELKETLLKVADYSELEKEKVRKAGSLAFLAMFFSCTIAIVLQMIQSVNLKMVLGETVVLNVGAITYVWLMVRNGLWEMNVKGKSTISKDIIISTIASAVFSVIFGICIWKLGAKESQIVRVIPMFFVGMMFIGFAVLRTLAYFSKKQRKEQNKA